METLTFNGTQYEVTDKYARKQIVDLKNKRNGKSTYQIAVDNGFEGTEKEWLLTIKGEKGDKGDKGDKGEQGERGLQGEQGNKGAKGDKGLKGDKGEQGIQGKSAYDIAVENGFNGSESEWVSSLKGDKGDQGQKGDQGLIGKSAYELAVAMGYKGDLNSWLNSLKGEKGDKGDRGEKGEQGIQGIQGERGEQGLKGDKGEKGDKGDTGAIGKSAYQIAVDNGFSGTESEWLASLKGTGIDSIIGTKKATITIIDDDGHKTLASTGLLAFCEERNIPLTFAYPSFAATSGNDFYSIEDLHELQKRGHEVVMHSNGNASTMSLETFKTMIDDSIAFAKANGLTDNIFVYPEGLQINTAINFDEKLAYVQENGIKLAYNVVTSVENASRTNYENWYDITTKGLYNYIPFSTMPNGVSKRFLLNRYSLVNLKYKANIKRAIESQSNICFYLHSYSDTDNQLDENNKSKIDYLKETIDDIISEYGDNVAWVTPSQLFTYEQNIEKFEKYEATYSIVQEQAPIIGVYLPNASNTSSKKVVASAGATTATFDANNFMTTYNVTSDDLNFDISAKTQSGDVVAYSNVSVTGGIVTITFDALAEQTTFICKCSVIQ